ncbi:FeoB-associated Cys-rich membrane protein [Mediannikoviicoccus vaginalis]|nr:FeoB-associated Cys-rich membrane protein [Mediannikoviicoccus vaginalis]
MIDYIIIGLVIILAIFAIRRVIKNKGTCDCGCECSKGCHGCPVNEKKKY